MGLYPSVRDSLLPPAGRAERGAAAEAWRSSVMVLSGFLSGALAYVVATPLWLLKTRAQTAAQLHSEGRAPSREVILPRTARGYYRGAGPLVLRGALVTAGQMFGYDYAKGSLKGAGLLADGPALHVVAGAAAGFWASTLSAPADVVMTRYQIPAAVEPSLPACVALVWREPGPR
ncbi:unnamed protein product, partial [Prorocentrum cordatum]